MGEFCEEHSGNCVEIKNTKSAVEKIDKKLDTIMILVVTNLLGFTVSLVMFLLNNLSKLSHSASCILSYFR